MKIADLWGKIVDLWGIDSWIDTARIPTRIVGASIVGLFGFYLGVNGWGILAGLILAAAGGAIGAIVGPILLFSIALLIHSAILVVPVILFILLMLYAFS